MMRLDKLVLPHNVGGSRLIAYSVLSCDTINNPCHYRSQAHFPRLTIKVRQDRPAEAPKFTLIPTHSPVLFFNCSASPFHI